MISTTTTNTICNKKISSAGQEWSAGRLGNRPIGARNATCKTKTCLGPYAIGIAIHPHYTGHKTMKKIMKKIKHRQENPKVNNKTSPMASTSRRAKEEDCTLPMTVHFALDHLFKANTIFFV